MVRGKIWGEFNGRYHEIEIEECDVIAVIELKNKGDMIGSQVSSLGGGLATEDCALSVADGVVRVIQAVEISPEEKKVLLRLLADGINCLTKESSPGVDEILEMNIPGCMPLWMECRWIQRAGTGCGRSRPWRSCKGAGGSSRKAGSRTTITARCFTIWR